MARVQSIYDLTGCRFSSQSKGSTDSPRKFLPVGGLLKFCRKCFFLVRCFEFCKLFDIVKTKNVESRMNFV